MEPKCTREGCGGLRSKHDVEAPHGYIDTDCAGYLAARPCDSAACQTPELLLPSAAGRLLGVSAATIRSWIYAGKLPALRLSGGVRAIRREDLEPTWKP